LKTLSQIKIHNFSWLDLNTNDVGVFAQELYKVYPSAVSKGDETDEIKKSWQVDYSKLVPVLIASVQELSTRNENLQNEINEIKQRLARLESLLNQA
ncbi:MAG: hypothetical protein RL018_996, partial [Pseudomonadota bacterium]